MVDGEIKCPYIGSGKEEFVGISKSLWEGPYRAGSSLVMDVNESNGEPQESLHYLVDTLSI